MKVVILCGGLGTRLREETEFRPKPLVEIGSRPVLWHIMKSYAHYGFQEFVLCLGYRGNMINDYFLNYEAMNNDFTITLGQRSQILLDGSHQEQGFRVTLADTGLESMTGGRIRRIAKYVGEDTFMMTYGDGLCDINIGRLLEFHRSHGLLATVTTVRPVLRFGVVDIDEENRVLEFKEKPVSEGWISAGFFVFNRGIFDYLSGDDCILERGPWSGWRARETCGVPSRGLLLCYGHLSRLPAPEPSLGFGQSALESVVMSDLFWRDRATLVTGATGLLGSWLVPRLVAAGADVVCLVRDWVPQSELVRTGMLDRVKVVRGDVCDRDTLERALGEYEIETVLHLDAQTIVGIANSNPISTFETNIQGTWNLLEVCRRSPKVRSVVIASSDKEYGTQEVLPYSEETPLAGSHPYDVSKSCADLLAHTYAVSYDLPVAITRCGNFYGGGDLNWNRVVPSTIRSVIRGERPVIRSDGHFIRDYFYVEDGVAAYMLLAERLAADATLRGMAFNFSNEIQVTVLDLVRRILAVMGSTLEPDIRNEAVNEIRCQCLSAERARRLLQWAPMFGLDGGLARTIAWYSEFFIDERASRSVT